MTEYQETWYILKIETGDCKIVSGSQFKTGEEAPNPQRWGPFASQAEAIARRVGLIRAGKCEPI